MNVIEWRANNAKQLVAFENSKALCDFENPQIQAQDWIKTIQIDAETEALCIVGCGSGYHIAEVSRRFPDLKVSVIESRPALIGFFAKKFPNVEFVYVEKIENLKTMDELEYLLSGKVEKKLFQPAIGYQNELLEEVYWFLNLRTFEALSYHLNKRIEGSAHALISLKQFIQNVDGSYQNYKLSEILTLKEIIK